jgi:hypothetical protein
MRAAIAPDGSTVADAGRGAWRRKLRKAAATPAIGSFASERKKKRGAHARAYLVRGDERWRGGREQATSAAQRG